MVQCSECGFQAKDKRGLSAHLRHTHGAPRPCPVCGEKFRNMGPHMRKHRTPQGVDYRQQRTSKTGRKDLMDALVVEFRQMLKDAQQTYAVIEKLREHIDDLDRAILELNVENRDLHKENAGLKGRLANAKTATRDLRRAVSVVPLEERLTEQEIQYLMQVKEGR